jgi:hypothetical protein
MIYGNAYEITQSPGYVAIRYEMVHETRIIPLGDSPRLPSNLDFLMGDARGRFEGDTLVVETTNIRPEAAYRNASEHLKIIERFTPTDENTPPQTQPRSGAVRVRVPRRQPGAAQHLERRARHRRRAQVTHRGRGATVMRRGLATRPTTPVAARR